MECRDFSPRARRAAAHFIEARIWNRENPPIFFMCASGSMVQSESPVTAGKLVRPFEVSVRTIRRDRRGIDISYDTAART